MEIPTKHGKRDYSKIINTAIHRARRRYDYPENNSAMGMKKILGRSYYAQLLEEELFDIKIPIKLKIKLIGKERYDELVKQR